MKLVKSSELEKDAGGREYRSLHVVERKYSISGCGGLGVTTSPSLGIIIVEDLHNILEPIMFVSLETALSTSILNRFFVSSIPLKFWICVSTGRSHNFRERRDSNLLLLVVNNPQKLHYTYYILYLMFRQGRQHVFPHRLPCLLYQLPCRSGLRCPSHQNWSACTLFGYHLQSVHVAEKSEITHRGQRINPRACERCYVCQCVCVRVLYSQCAYFFY